MKRFFAFALALLLAFFAVSCAMPEEEKVPEETEKPKTVYEIVGTIIGKNSYYDSDVTDDDIAKALIDAYVASTGDRHARYYNEEEFLALQGSSTGETVGIGVVVIENPEYKCIEVIGVVPDTPADVAGVQAGDLIVRIGNGDDAEDISKLSYEVARTKLAGEAGTLCEFGVVRYGNFDEIIEFSVTREKYTYDSVMLEVCEADPSIGIVKIRKFNYTTPAQFKNVINTLSEKGCTRFVFDLRNNVGGSLDAVEAMISYFANPGDILFRRKDRNGNMTTNYCEVKTYGGERADCSVAEEEMGMYRELENIVVMNEYTASAAELFAAALSDYELTTTVGVQTYGKGTTQTVYDLSNYGDYKGGIKLTTRFYYPPTSDNYDGVGITPDVIVEPDEVMKTYNTYKLLLPEYQKYDNQLAAAVEILQK